MKLPFRSGLVLTLLLVMIGVNFFSLLLYAGLDNIVHVDLYRYGLQFSYDWASQYWLYTMLFFALQGLSSLMGAVSVA